MNRKCRRVRKGVRGTILREDVSGWGRISLIYFKGLRPTSYNATQTIYITSYNVNDFSPHLYQEGLKSPEGPVSYQPALRGVLDP